MMNKHDEKIQNLFDDYAGELTPRKDLAEKALKQMVENKSQPSTSVRKNSSFLHYFAWITPIVAVFVVVLVVMFSLPTFSVGPGDMTTPDSSENVPGQSAPSVTYYTFADVKGRKVSLDDYDDKLQISKLVSNGYDVVGQQCYAFFTQQDELRYVKVLLGVRSPDGTFTELTLIAEVDGYVRRDLRDIYEQNSSIDGLGVNSYFDSNGEYVTQGYFEARNLHFYIVAQNGQCTEVAEDIMEHLAY